MQPEHPMRRLRPGRATPSQDRLEELLATVAHELRRPLTALLGALATVQQRSLDLSAAEQQELLTLARRQGTHLQGLLEQLLAAALDQPQTAPARVSLVDAAALATQAGVAAQLAHPHHRITIDAAGPLLVRADPLAITCILGNLLDNAATHTPPGTPIRLLAGRDEHEAVLAVHDQGRGVPPAARERIFERFTRLDRPTEPTAGGLGLGLHIAQQLAHAYGGQLRCTDPPSGQGASFELRLPSPPTADPSPPATTGDANR
jgi:two-component system OmpR family sensor kinase